MLMKFDTSSAMGAGDDSDTAVPASYAEAFVAVVAQFKAHSQEKAGIERSFSSVSDAHLPSFSFEIDAGLPRQTQGHNCYRNRLQN